MTIEKTWKWIPLVAVLSTVCIATGASAGSIGGIDDAGVPRDVAPTSVSFDPPGGFISTVAATGWIAKGSGVKKLKGTGAVLSAPGFGIIGTSPPSLLAWNCEAVLSDGQTPQLPETITFSSANTQVSLNVGGVLEGVGKSVRISGGGDSEVVVLTDTMQTVTLTGEKIKSVKIEDAIEDVPVCVLAIDDIQLVPVP